MRVGLIPGSFKPYHVGHDTLVRRAAAENDRVLVAYSTADRARKGEPAISGEASAKIMREFVAPTLPSNVTLVPVRVPVRHVYEIIIGEEDRFVREGVCNQLTIYADSSDIENFKNLERYAPVMMARGQINFATMTRGEDSPKVSGTIMRAHAQSGDIYSFREGLPPALRPRAEEIIEALGFKDASITNDAVSRVIEALLRENGKMKTKNRKRRHTVSSLRESYDFESGYGMEGFNGAIFKSFVQPFVDVLKVGKNTISGLVNALRLNLSLINPLFSDERVKIAQARYREMDDRLSSEWQETLGRDWDTIKEQGAVWAFGYSPGRFLALKAASMLLPGIGRSKKTATRDYNSVNQLRKTFNSRVDSSDYASSGFVRDFESLKKQKLLTVITCLSAIAAGFSFYRIFKSTGDFESLKQQMLQITQNRDKEYTDKIKNLYADLEAKIEKVVNDTIRDPEKLADLDADPATQGLRGAELKKFLRNKILTSYRQTFIEQLDELMKNQADSAINKISYGLPRAGSAAYNAVESTEEGKKLLSLMRESKDIVRSARSGKIKNEELDNLIKELKKMS